MQKALEQLGLGPCYHMRTAMNEYPRDCAMWLEAFQATYDGVGTFEKDLCDQLLGNYSVSPHNLRRAGLVVLSLQANQFRLAFTPQLCRNSADSFSFLNDLSADVADAVSFKTYLMARSLSDKRASYVPTTTIV